MENTVDVQHFTPMHGLMAIPWTEIRIPFLEVLFDSKVVLGRDKDASLYGPEGHPEWLYFVNASKLRVGGRDIPKTDATVVVQFIADPCAQLFDSASSQQFLDHNRLRCSHAMSTSDDLLLKSRIEDLLSVVTQRGSGYQKE